MHDAEPAAQEQTYFDDPALDRMFGVIFRVATELQITRATVQQMQALLDQHGITGSQDGCGAVVSEERRAAWRADCAAYVENILSPLLGRAHSRSAP